MEFTKKLLGGLFAAAVLVPVAAHATPTLRLTVDGSTTLTCADGDACDASAIVGVVQFNGPVGAYNFNFTTGLGGGVSSTFLMHFNSLDLQTGSGAHTLEILFSDTGFTQLGLVNGAWGGVLSGAGSVSASVAYSLTNNLFDQAVSLGSAGPFGGGAFSANLAGAVVDASPYSLTERIFITSTGPVTYSGDFELKIPEPGVVALAGLGLFALAAVRRRKQ